MFDSICISRLFSNCISLYRILLASSINLLLLLSSLLLLTDNMEITSVCSPEVNTYMSDRNKVAEYHAIYINFRKFVKVK